MELGCNRLKRGLEYVRYLKTAGGFSAILHTHEDSIAGDAVMNKAQNVEQLLFLSGKVVLTCEG